MRPGAKEHACGKARYRYRLEVSLSWEFRSVPGSSLCSFYGDSGNKRTGGEHDAQHAPQNLFP